MNLPTIETVSMKVARAITSNCMWAVLALTLFFVGYAIGYLILSRRDP